MTPRRAFFTGLSKSRTQPQRESHGPSLISRLVISSSRRDRHSLLLSLWSHLLFPPPRLRPGLCSVPLLSLSLSCSWSYSVLLISAFHRIDHLQEALVTFLEFIIIETRTTMGQSSSKSSNPAPLLQPSMEGNLDEVKRIVGRHIATCNSSSSSSSADHIDPQLRSFVDQTDSQGNAAVHGASFGGHLDILQFLVQQCGADVISARNHLGCTPLWLAAGYGHNNILIYLIDRIGSVSSLVLSPQEIILAENNTGDTPLLAAASKGHVEVCKLLIEAVDKCHGCSGGDAIRRTNKTGDTPLAVAVGAGHGDELLDLLLEWNAKDENVDERAINMRNSNGLTPLLVACERNSAPIAKKLIEHGALPLRDSNGASPLAVAAFCGCDDIVAALLELDFGKELLNVQDEAGGCTPLWLASRTGNAKMVRLLLDAGADPTIKNIDGLTAEEAAVKYEKKKVMEIFGYDIQQVKDGDDDKATDNNNQ